MKIYDSKIKKIVILGVLLIVAFTSSSAVCAPLTDSTTATIVNVTVRLYGSTPTGATIDTWPHWPTTDNDSHLKITHPYDDDLIFLDNVHLGETHMQWNTDPFNTEVKWRRLNAAGVNSMIAIVYAHKKNKDGIGTEFTLKSWDYLTGTTHSKGTECGHPDNWSGTIIHGFKDFEPPQYDTGKERTNLVFQKWPYTVGAYCR